MDSIQFIADPVSWHDTLFALIKKVDSSAYQNQSKTIVSKSNKQKVMHMLGMKHFAIAEKKKDQYTVIWPKKKTSLITIANNNPELRKHIVPILKQASGPYKVIIGMDGKKVQLERSHTKYLAEVQEDGHVKVLTWPQWVKSPLKDKTKSIVQSEFLHALAKQIKNMGTMVDYNTEIKSGKLKDFDSRMGWLLKHGAKYTKRGLKV